MALKKLQFSGQSGMTAFAVIGNSIDEFFNGTNLSDYLAANFPTYKISIPELGKSGRYSADIPDNLPPGRYHVSYHMEELRPESPQIDEYHVVFQANIDWDGTQVVDDLVVGMSITNICNLALSHLAHGKQIANMETDKEEAALACKLYYDIVRDSSLRDFQWAFATRIATLPLVEENPNSEWCYSYRYPSNALLLRKISSGMRNDTRQSLVSYRVIGDDTGRLILTDKQNAIAEFTSRVTNPLKYPPDFTMALSLRLAAYIAPRLTGGDAYKLGERAMQLYLHEIRKAEVGASNERVHDEYPDSEFVRGR